jgi:hypothetical protein
MKLEVILDEFAYLDNPRKWDNKQAKRSLRIGKETQMIEPVSSRYVNGRQVLPACHHSH